MKKEIEKAYYHTRKETESKKLKKAENLQNILRKINGYKQKFKEQWQNTLKNSTTIDKKQTH